MDKKKISFLFGNNNQVAAQSYIWYSLGGVLNAGQSAILLMVISRTNSIEDAGIFAIGYAIACLALSVGNYGIRNFQATDVNDNYDFHTYLTTRLITDIAMLILIGFYVVKGLFILEYSIDKCLVIILLGISKLIDSIEDVFHGMYQKKGRLDVAGRCLTTRYIILLFSYIFGLVLFHNLVLATFISVLFSLIYFVFTISVTIGDFHEKIELRFGDKNIIKLLVDCVSLFAGGFFALYIANAPKYAIDAHRTEVEQACFNYIFMPVYVINLLNTFIYQPMLTQMADMYAKNFRKEFYRVFFKQIMYITLLFICMIVGGWFLGIPILSILYNTKLDEYKVAFMVLLIGSGFLATEGYVASVIVLMRKQSYLLIGYGISTLTALFCSNHVVMNYGVIGAAVLYSAIVGLQMLVFVVLLAVCDRKWLLRLR